VSCTWPFRAVVPVVASFVLSPSLYAGVPSGVIHLTDPVPAFAPAPVTHHDVDCVIDFDSTAPTTAALATIGSELLEDLHLASGGSVELCAFDISLYTSFLPTVGFIHLYAMDPVTGLPGAIVAGPYQVDVTPTVLNDFHIEVGGLTIPGDIWMGLSTEIPEDVIGWRLTQNPPSVGTSSDSAYRRGPGGTGFLPYRLQTTLYGTPVITSVDDPAHAVPALRLELPGPNPARTSTWVVSYSTPWRGPARLELVDASGRRWKRADVAALEPGTHQVGLEGWGRVPPGAYFVRFTQNGRSVSRRIIRTE